MNWFWFALLSAVCFSTFSVLVRLTLKDQGDAKAFAPIANAIVGLLLLGIALFEETFFRPQFWDYILLIMSSMALAGGSYLIIRARQIAPVSQIALVHPLAMVWTFIGGFPGENAKFFTVRRHGQHHSQGASHLQMLITS